MTACNNSPGGNKSPDVNSPDVYNSPDGNYSPALPMPQAKGCFVQGLLPRCLPLLQNLLSCCKCCFCPGYSLQGFAVPTVCPRPLPSSHQARNMRAIA